MDITPLGLSSFRIRGKNATIVTDPYDSATVGLKFPKNVEADIVTVSHGHKDHNAVSAVAGAPFVIIGPGEYEVKGVSVIGFPSFHDAEKGAKRGRNTIFRIEVDGVSLVHMGDLGHALTTEEVDALDGVDILMIPVGGTYTIDAVQALNSVKEVEPKIVIPMHYGGNKLPFFSDLAPVSAFLKEMGLDAVVPQPKLTISKEKLPEQMLVTVLE